MVQQGLCRSWQPIFEAFRTTTIVHCSRATAPILMVGLEVVFVISKSTWVLLCLFLGVTVDAIDCWRWFKRRHFCLSRRCRCNFHGSWVGCLFLHAASTELWLFVKFTFSAHLFWFKIKASKLGILQISFKLLFLQLLHVKILTIFEVCLVEIVCQKAGFDRRD